VGKTALLKNRICERPPERADSSPCLEGEAKASPSSPLPRKKRTLYIGFDAEWFTERTVEFFKQVKTKYGTETRRKALKHFRKVLCIQAWGILDGKDLGGLIWWCVDPKDPYGSKEKRPSLWEFLDFCLSRWKIDRKEIGKIIFVAHFNMVDFGTFRDFHEYLSKENPKKGLIRIKKAYRGKISKRNSPLKVPIFLKDTFEVYHCSLKDLGKVLGVEKIEIGKENLENMAEFLLKDREMFEKYALRDAEVAVKGWLAHERFCKEQNLKMASTAGGVAERTLHERLKALGDEDVKKNLFDKQRHERQKGRTQVRIKPLGCILDDYTNFVRAYYGGRNETWMYGFWKGLAVDWDLCGAYGTITSNIPKYWPVPYEASNPDPADIYERFRETPTVLGYVTGWFTLKDKLVGGIPIRDDNATYFVRCGRTTMTIQEFLALYPDLEPDRTYIYKVKVFQPLPELSEAAKLAREFMAKRAEAKKRGDSFGDKFFKLLVNSFYGKFAQGVRDDIARYALGKQLTERKAPPPSLITNPAIAGYITGFIRALAYEALKALIKLRFDIVAWTTDGALTLVPGGEEQFREVVEKVLKAEEFGLMHDKFREFRREVAGSDNCYEIKHFGHDVLAIRTRAYAILNPKELPEYGVKAKNFARFTGVQETALKELEPEKKLAQIIFDLWKETKRGDRIEVPESRYVTKSEFERAYEYFFLRERDVFDPEEELELEHAFDPGNVEEIIKNLNFDYDFKRRPIQIEECPEVPGKVRFRTIASWDSDEVITRRYYATHFEKWKGIRDGKQILANKFLDLESVRKLLDYIELKSLNLEGYTTTRKILGLAGAWYVKQNPGAGLRRVAAFLGIDHKTIMYHQKRTLGTKDFEKIFETDQFQAILLRLEKEFGEIK